MNKKILNILLISILIFSIVFFALIDNHHEEDCHEEHCFLCSIIYIGKMITNLLILLILHICLKLIVLINKLLIDKTKEQYINNSLIYQKVRFNE